MSWCPECRSPKDESEMTSIPASKSNVIRRCCKPCKARIIGLRKKCKKDAKCLAKQG